MAKLKKRLQNIIEKINEMTIDHANNAGESDTWNSGYTVEDWYEKFLEIRNIALEKDEIEESVEKHKENCETFAELFSLKIVDIRNGEVVLTGGKPQAVFNVITGETHDPADFELGMLLTYCPHCGRKIKQPGLNERDLVKEEEMLDEIEEEERGDQDV